MTKAELTVLIQANLSITNKDLIVSDAIILSAEYCNLDVDNLPDAIEPIIRRKVKSIIDYEAKLAVSPVLSASVYDVKSITEGDSSVTYNVDDNHSKDVIYDLSETDKRALTKFRRLRR